MVCSLGDVPEGAPLRQWADSFDAKFALVTACHVGSHGELTIRDQRGNVGARLDRVRGKVSFFFEAGDSVTTRCPPPEYRWQLQWGGEPRAGQDLGNVRRVSQSSSMSQAVDYAVILLNHDEGREEDIRGEGSRRLDVLRAFVRGKCDEVRPAASSAAAMLGADIFPVSAKLMAGTSGHDSPASLTPAHMTATLMFAHPLGATKRLSVAPVGVPAWAAYKPAVELQHATPSYKCSSGALLLGMTLCPMGQLRLFPSLKVCGLHVARPAKSSSVLVNKAATAKPQYFTHDDVWPVPAGAAVVAFSGGDLFRTSPPAAGPSGTYDFSAQL